MFSNCCLMQKYSCFSLIRAYLSHLQKPRAVNPALTWTCYLWNKWKGRERRGAAWPRAALHLSGYMQARGELQCPGWCNGSQRVWVSSGNGKNEEKQQNICNQLKLGKVAGGCPGTSCMFGCLGWKSFPLINAGMFCWWISSVEGGLTPGDLHQGQLWSQLFLRPCKTWSSRLAFQNC